MSLLTLRLLNLINQLATGKTLFPLLADYEHLTDFLRH